MLARILGTLRGIPVSVILVSFSALFADVTVSVDWSKVKRTVDPLSYGVNGSYAYMANRTGNAAYRAGIKYAIGKPEGGTSLLRLHRQGLIGAWSSGGAWNSGTIIGGLKPLIDDKFDLMIGFDRAIGGVSSFVIVPVEHARGYTHNASLPPGAVQGLARETGPTTVALTTNRDNRLVNGRRYVVFLSWPRESIPVAVLDLPAAAGDYSATLAATLDGAGVLARSARQGSSE